MLSKKVERISLSGQGELVQRLGDALPGYIGNNLLVRVQLFDGGLQGIVGKICQR